MEKCVLSGKEITSFGSIKKKDADGVHTNIGPVHKEAYDQYHNIIDISVNTELRNRDISCLRDPHVRKRALEILKNIQREEIAPIAHPGDMPAP